MLLVDGLNTKVASTETDVLASALSVSSEREGFLGLVNKEEGPNGGDTRFGLLLLLLFCKTRTLMYDMIFDQTMWSYC